MRCAVGLMALAACAGAANADVVNFDLDGLGNPLAAGTIIDDEYANLGVTFSTDDPVNNPLMIFDSANPTGGDQDLGTPNEDFGGPGEGTGGEAGQAGENNTALGNVLIISEDGDASDPDDSASGGIIRMDFDFDAFVGQFAILDVDKGGSVARFLDENDNVLLSVPFGNLGDNAYQELDVNLDGVRAIEFDLAGSGAITGVVFTPAPSGVALLGLAGLVARRRR